MHNSNSNKTIVCWGEKTVWAGRANVFLASNPFSDFTAGFRCNKKYLHSGELQEGGIMVNCVNTMDACPFCSLARRKNSSRA